MEKIYIIKHLYDVDGGFGDAVTDEEIIGATFDKAEAEAYVKKHSKKVLYDMPYDELYYGELLIEEMEIGLPEDPFKDCYFEDLRKINIENRDPDDAFGNDETESEDN